MKSSRSGGHVIDASRQSWLLGPGWLAPTCRAIRVSLLGSLALGASGIATAMVLDVGSVAAAPWITSLILGGLATCAALALADPAADLLAAVPGGRTRRVVHRLVLAVPLTAVVVGAIALVSGLLAAGESAALPAMSVGRLLALVALAVAADAWSSRPTAAAAAAVPIFVVVAGRIVPAETIPGELVASWSKHPWAVVTVATSLSVALHRR